MGSGFFLEGISIGGLYESTHGQHLRVTKFLPRWLVPNSQFEAWIA